MPFGDFKCNMEVNELGFCRCHGVVSFVRTPNGDFARVTAIQECIMQRIGIWLAVKKGERPLFPNFGCCIRGYINKPLTVATLKALKGEIIADLRDLFPEPELQVKNLIITVPERNTISVRAYIGNFEILFTENEAELNKLNSQLQMALSDLGMG